MGQILALCSHKGGVAKTTSCISLGACLAELGYRTLLVDLDPQAHLTLAAGLNADEQELTTVDFLNGTAEAPTLEEFIQPTSMPGLQILPADLRLAELEHSLAQRPAYEQILRDAFAPYRASFDTILLDCPPSLGTVTLMALSAADWALAPVPCDYFATRSLLHLLDVFDAVRQRTNPALKQRLFVSMYDGRTSITRRVLEQLREHFGDLLFQTVIGMDVRLRESILAGEPVIVYAPRSRASQQYRSLAMELAATISGMEETV